jgi:hypothetical protein
MVTPESIQLGIAQGMATEYLSVTGDGQHFEAIVVSAELAGRAALGAINWFIRHWVSACEGKSMRCP